MKITYKIILLLITGLFPALLSAQSNALDGLLSKYADQPGFYFLELKTNMFSSEQETNGSPTPGKLITVKILSYEEGSSNQSNATDVYEQLRSEIDVNTYKGLIEVKSSGDKIDMMVKKDGVKLSEIVIIVRESTETTVIAASGSLDLKDIAKFSEMKNCHSLETLKKLCED
jgi:hypothetical protein